MESAMIELINKSERGKHRSSYSYNIFRYVNILAPEINLEEFT
jgi:hypothetical protein